MRHRLSGPGFAAALALLCGLAFTDPAQAAPQRVRITGEVVDSWCQLTGIMYPLGTAHHQCAVWCTVGGIPVGVLGDDGNTYMLMTIEGDGENVANPRMVEIQTNRVTVDGDLYVRDGVNYLIVEQVVTDEGIVNRTHEEYGIQPFGE